MALTVISIDYATGKKEVVDLWKNHFEQLLNCVHGKNISGLGYECKFVINMIIRYFIESLERDYKINGIVMERRGFII